MTTEEQILQNRATTEIIRYWVRVICRSLRSVYPTWNFSYEVGEDVIHGLIVPTTTPAAVNGFSKLTSSLRVFSGKLNVRIEGGPLIVPVAGKTLPLYFPPPPAATPGTGAFAASSPSPAPWPPLDVVPDPNKLPPNCPICGEKEFVA